MPMAAASAACTACRLAADRCLRVRIQSSQALAENSATRPSTTAPLTPPSPFLEVLDKLNNAWGSQWVAKASRPRCLRSRVLRLFEILEPGRASAAEVRSAACCAGAAGKRIRSDQSN